jgi:four helix bundle protein
MFIALSVSLSVIRALRPIVAHLRRHDAALARQICNAASSVSLNVAEGAKRSGKDQAHFYRIAAGSCAEVRAALAVGAGWGWLDGADWSAAESLLDRQAALLYRLINRRAA